MGILWNGNEPSKIIWSRGLSYIERNVGPINTWTIPSTTTDVVSYSGTNTISLNGKGGHYETCYKEFTVSQTGTYTISYDYDLPTINFYGTGSSHMHFGIYITTNQPPGGDMPTYSDYSTGNCNGTDICGPSSQYNTPGSGHISFNYNLTAGTKYYLWIPMMNLADGVQTYLTFTNLDVKSVNQLIDTVEPELWYNGSKVWPTAQPAPSLPSDMDFVYQAKDFDGSKIPNKAPNSTFGDYLKQGTLTLNGSGSSAYLTNNLSASNYLYKDLTTNELNAQKATNSTYTFFFRVMQDQSGMGGIVSWRNGSSYIYMIRAENYQVQIHTTSGYNCGSDFSLSTDRVYKVVVNGSSFKAYNLDNNAEYSLTYSTNRTMTSRMATFNADRNYSTEAKLSRFYALAGIARATTAEEDAIIKNVLMNQSA